jgi:hypothetical protein
LTSSTDWVVLDEWVVLVGNDDRKDVVAEVKNSMFKGQALI